MIAFRTHEALDAGFRLNPGSPHAYLDHLVDLASEAGLGRADADPSTTGV